MSAEKDRPGLNSFLEEDREKLMSDLKADPSKEHAGQVLDRELERLSLRAAEYSLGEDAGQMLLAARNTLPVINAVSDVEEWQISSPKQEVKTAAPPLLSILLGAAGIVFILMGRGLHLSSILLTLGGIVSLGGGAYLAGLKNRKVRPKAEQGEMKRKFLVSPEEVYHVLMAMTLAADRSLETGRMEERQMIAAESAMNSGDTDFYAELLEYAYRMKRSDENHGTAEEMIGHIRYYLHSAGIEIADYSPEHSGWFELLPGGQGMTLRPALIKDGAPVHKGLASV